MAAGHAVRAAIGVITPLAIGVATGKVEYGSYAALGALPAGFVSFRGVTRTRVLAVLLAAAGMAVSTFVGATTAASAPWLLVVVVFAWAYAAGLLASLGPAATAVTLQWPVALLIASALPLSPADAGIRALLVLAGGLWQCLLVISSWTVNRGSAERSAVARSYHTLAAYATAVGAGQNEPPPAGQLPGTKVLADPNPLIRTMAREHLLDLAEEAERIRRTLAALSILSETSENGPVVRRIATVAAGILNELASGLSTARLRQRAERVSSARRELTSLSAEGRDALGWAGETLIGQLRGACRIAGRLNDADLPSVARRTTRVIQPGWFRNARLTLRASIGTSSESGRHALRLAVVATLAETLVRASGLGHGYWAVLTVFIVLRPDYSSTLYRGLQRAVGTVIGAGLGICTVLLEHISLSALLTGTAVSLVAAYAVFTVNYLLYAVFLTDFVLVLLALLGLPPGSTALARLAGTGIGTGLALVAYVLWPSWEGTSSAEKFARLIGAQGQYAAILLRSYTRPGGIESSTISRLQIAARRARIDAEASADRLVGEPDHPPMTASTAVALESAGHRMAQALLTLGGVVAAHHSGPPPTTDAVMQPRLDDLAAGVEEATGQISESLRAVGSTRMPAPLRLPPLHAEQEAIWRSTAAAEPQAPTENTEEEGLFAATDGLVDAITTAADVMRRWVRTPSA